MPYILPPLAYAFNALEPHFDATTMEIHHDRHHATYVTNLNNALANHADLQAHSIEDLCKNIASVPEVIRAPVRNNGGGHFNHSMFWGQLKPGGSALSGSLKAAIEAKWSSVDNFKAEFEKAGLGRFGSGWVWLIADGGGVAIMSTPNQDNPLMEGKTPLLGVDVWEHAYYLKYQNKRADYLKAFWNVCHWDDAEKRFAAAK